VQNNPVNYSDPLGLWRLPDYVSLNINIAIPTPWTGTLIGITPVALSLDRYGNWYYGLGPNVGKALTFVSGSLTAGWLDQECKPTEGQMNNFLSGHGVNAGAGYWGGFGAQWSPANASATYIGIVTPQAGVGYTYSWWVGRWNLSW